MSAAPRPKRLGRARSGAGPGAPLSAVQRAASALSPERRPADCLALAERRFDMLVIGGGVTGAGTALDAATRGLSVGLVEAQDWASGTSSKSSKLVHGGLRYLQMLDFHLVREGLKERALLLQQLAPHLVRPVPILYPLRRPVLDRAYVGAGVGLYDLMGYTLGGERGGLPWHKHLSRSAAMQAAPALRAGALTGAIVYHDGQVDDARFVVELVRTACAFGAVAVNRMAAVGFLREEGRVSGALLRDVETGQQIAARARVTVIATGAWAEETEALAGHDRALRVRPSKGVHLVVPRERLALSTGLIMPTERSVLFVLPWGRYWLVGTTDTDWVYGKGSPLATSADVAYLLGELNSVLSDPLGPDDVVSVFAGLRPLVAGKGVVRGPGEGHGGATRKPVPPAEDEASSTKVSREHSVGAPAPGLVVVSGGKYTTYRVMARDVVDVAFADPAFSGDGHSPPSVTEKTPLLGARRFDECWAQREELSSRYGVAEEQVERLLHRYGSQSPQVLELTVGQPALAQPLEGADDHLAAEVVYAVSHEGARHLEDVMARRTRLAISSPRAGLASAEAVSRLMAPLLGWDDGQRRAELTDYRRQVDLLFEAATAATDDEEASRWAAKVAPLMPPP